MPGASYHSQQFAALQEMLDQGTVTLPILNAYLTVGEVYFRDLASRTTGSTRDGHLLAADQYRLARRGDALSKAQYCSDRAAYFLHLARAQKGDVLLFRLRAAQWFRLANLCLTSEQEESGGGA